MKRVGVLGLQGGVVEHMNCLKSVRGVEAVWVRKLEELEGLSGLILPGGESSTLGLLLRKFGWLEILKQKIENGLPVWGTCAGMILLAEAIEGESGSHLATMAIKVRRNAYGRQLESFDEIGEISKIGKEPIRMRFVRAPLIESWDEKKVDILCRVLGKAVAARQGHMLVTSFHPELVGEIKVHEYFVNEMCR